VPLPEIRGHCRLQRGELALQRDPLHATGADDEARAAILRAREKLVARADKIKDPSLREAFLEDEPDNRRTMDLARAWLNAPAGAPR
jgi:hypothetical protein